MILYYVFLVILLFFGARFHRKDTNGNYLTKPSTNVIKGFFIALIFMSHIQGYIRQSGYGYDALGDDLVLDIQATMGQLVVVMFLFYSGYGIMESYKKKGALYISSMPKRRILTTLVNFDIAVLAFIAVDLILGIHLGTKQTLLSFFAWKSVGNSNWYIFVILLCYVIAYVALIIKEKYKLGGGIFTLIILSLTFAAFLFLLIGKTSEGWWYNTFFCFGAGITYSIYKDGIEKQAKAHYTIVLLTTIAILIMIELFPKTMHGLKDNIFFMAFAFLIVLITMKIEFGSKPLQWMGERLFPLYIYQRIPMIVLYEFDKGHFVSNHLYLYILMCGITTLLLGSTYRYWQVRLS